MSEPLPPYETTADSAAIDSIKKLVEAANPGSEVWLGRHPKTQDWWLYAPATKPVARTYRKKLGEQQARGELGDMDVAYEHLIYNSVLYPSKEDLTQLLVRRPMLGSVIAGEICEVSGFTTEAVQKKL